MSSEFPVCGEQGELRHLARAWHRTFGLPIIVTLLAIAERGTPGQTYLVGSGDELSNAELVRQVFKILDLLDFPLKPHERLIEFAQDRPAHDLRYASDSSKTRREIGWSNCYNNFDIAVSRKS